MSDILLTNRRRLLGSKNEKTYHDYIQDGLVVLFDVGCGTVKEIITDTAPNSITGTIPIKDGGFYFNGSSYANFSSLIDSQTTWNNTTVEYVIRLNKFNGGNMMPVSVIKTVGSNFCSPYFRYTLTYVGGGMGSTRVTYNRTIPLNEKFGLSIRNVASTSSALGYFNGSKISSVSTNRTNNSNRHFYLGWCSGASDGIWNGYIYSIRIYNRLLTADEVLQNWEVDNERFNITPSIMGGGVNP